MTMVPVWPEGPRRPRCDSSEEHVWSIELEVAADELPELERHLSSDERERAARFAFAPDRARFIVAHGLLRTILAAYLDTTPSAIRFRTNEFGKPSVEGQSARCALHFNFSHSDGLALCAVARGRSLGVDVERVRPIPSPEKIAERFFSRREYAALLSLPEAQRREAFYACWSRKEAYVKGRGMGLSLALDSFDTSLAPGEPAALLGSRDEASDAAGWTLHELSPASGYTAALATEGGGGPVRCFHMPGMVARRMRPSQPG
ncbi:MAG TPA: 4'-phosphopantetheinyl transferase superfamily protein [Gemmatimonadaceae bacterium]|jgi:Phosphopantetheinyl transferase